jgi:hypothetical protein
MALVRGDLMPHGECGRLHEVDFERDIRIGGAPHGLFLVRSGITLEVLAVVRSES